MIGQPRSQGAQQAWLLLEGNPRRLVCALQVRNALGCVDPKAIWQSCVDRPFSVSSWSGIWQVVCAQFRGTASLYYMKGDIPWKLCIGTQGYSDSATDRLQFFDRFTNGELRGRVWDQNGQLTGQWYIFELPDQSGL